VRERAGSYCLHAGNDYCYRAGPGISLEINRTAASIVYFSMYFYMFHFVLINLLICLFMYLFIYSSFIYSFFIHSFVHSFSIVLIFVRCAVLFLFRFCAFYISHPTKNGKSTKAKQKQYSTPNKYQNYTKGMNE
jgi:hypothetical protein